MIRHVSLEVSNKRFAIMLLVPTMVVLFGLYTYPLCYSFYLSITNTNFFLPNVTTKIVRLKNYIDLFQDENFINSIIISFSFAGLVTIAELIIGMVLALLYSKEKFGLGFLRSIIIIPMMITPVCAGLIWKYMFHPAFGLVNYILGLMGFHRLGWHTEMSTAFLTVVLVDVWMLTPFVIIIAISGLSALPHELYEAADIDGANGWKKFTHITLPLMKPIIVIIVLIRLIDAFKVFDNVWIMTRGGPVRRTELFTIFAYKDAMLRGNLGSGAAASIIILIVVLILCVSFIKFSKVDY
jgi:multiple sugar transport system permease protein